MKDFPKPHLENTTLRRPDSPQKRRFSKGLGFMATQMIAFRAGHQSASDLNVVRQDFNTHDNSGRLPRRNKLRTNNSPNESIDNCVHDSERIMGVRAATKIV